MVVLPFAGSQFNASLTWLFIKAALVLSPLYVVVVLAIYAAAKQARRTLARAH